MRVVAGTLSLLALGANAYGDDITVRPSQCGASSEYIGVQGYFTGGHRGCRYRWVSPKLTILDDCSFELSGFDFDFHGESVTPVHDAPGAKLWVHYAADKDDVLDDDEDGVAVSVDLQRNYAGETVYGSLPAGASWSQFTTVSVYCEDRDVNFGYFNIERNPDFVEDSAEMEDYWEFCCDDGTSCDEFWKGTTPYAPSDDDDDSGEMCGGTPSKPCKECVRKYCDDVRGKNARLDCLRDDVSKHHLYEDMCLEELGLPTDSAEMCGGTATKPCKDCAEQYCDHARGKTARLNCLINNVNYHHLYEDMCLEELGLATEEEEEEEEEDDEICSGTFTKPCKGCVNRYCREERGKPARLDCLRELEEKHHLYSHQCLAELGISTEDSDDEECGGTPSKPCKDCAREYCSHEHGKTARLNCLWDRESKHHLYSYECKVELGLAL